MQGFSSVPFKSESAHGFTSVNGFAKFSRAGVVLEFESKLLGLISDGVKEVRLSIAEIHDVKFKKGVFKRGSKIEIRTRSMAKLKELPNSEGKVTLKIQADDFELARDAVAQLHKDMAEKADALPPTHTPVSVLFDASEEETQELKNG